MALGLTRLTTPNRATTNESKVLRDPVGQSSSELLEIMVLMPPWFQVGQPTSKFLEMMVLMASGKPVGQPSLKLLEVYVASLVLTMNL